jgi:hypothetical protein
MTRYMPLWLQEGDYAASVDRRILAAIWPDARTAGLAVTALAATTVLVAPGSGAVPAQNGTGSVLCVSDAPEPVDLPAAPAGGNFRVDLVILYPRSADIGVSGGITDFVFTYVSGPTDISNPQPPAVPAGTIGLARILRIGGSAVIQPGDITDTRPGGLNAPGPGAAEPWPRGNVGRTVGPATQTDCGATLQTVASLTFTPTVGRRYRIYGEGLAQQLTAASATVQMQFAAVGVIRFLFYTSGVNLPALSWISGSSFIDVAPASATPITAAINGQSVAGALRFRPSESSLSVDDVGAI